LELEEATDGCLHGMHLTDTRILPSLAPKAQRLAPKAQL